MVRRGTHYWRGRFLNCGPSRRPAVGIRRDPICVIFASPRRPREKSKIRRESKGYLEQVGLSVDPDTTAGELSIGHQQLVEIAKALSVNARVLIMDEPTSSLSGHETERLFEVIDLLRESGVSIVYISPCMVTRDMLKLLKNMPFIF